MNVFLTMKINDFRGDLTDMYRLKQNHRAGHHRLRRCGHQRLVLAHTYGQVTLKISGFALAEIWFRSTRKTFIFFNLEKKKLDQCIQETSYLILKTEALGISFPEAEVHIPKL